MVDEWFLSWAMRHVARFPATTFPELGTNAADVFFDSWRSVFIRRGISDEAIAEEASITLMGERLKHSSEHFPRLVEIAIDLYKARSIGESQGIDPRSFEAARSASMGCEHCSGQGLAVVYHPAPDAARKIDPTTAAHCVCLAGRWVRRDMAKKDPHLLRRIPDLAEVLLGRTVWLAVPLIDPDYQAERFAKITDPAAMFAMIGRRIHGHSIEGIS